jgi:hypothetical protein
VAGWDQSGGDADLHAVGSDRTDDGQKFDGIPELSGERDVLGREIPDSLDGNLGKGREEPVRQEAKDGGLVGGIDAVHV